MVKSKFNRSAFMKERHEFTRQQRARFSKDYGEELPYNEFMKNETPLSDKIIVYDVSYQLNYTGEVDSMIINKQTLKVVAFEGQEEVITNKVMESLTTAKGSNTKHHLSTGTTQMIEDNATIIAKPKSYPRGMERSQRKPTKQEIDEVIKYGLSVSNIEDKVKFTNKKGRIGKLDMDLRHF